MGTLVTVELPSVTGIKRDSFSHSFAIGHIDPLNSTQRTGIATAVTAFYNTIPTGDAAALGAQVSAEVSRAASACIIRQYDITGKLGINPATGNPYPHGSPVEENAFTLIAASGTTGGFPGEVAIVATLEAAGRDDQPVEVDGTPPERPKQRYTGRLYFGPLTVPAGATTTYPVRPASAMTQRLRRGFDDLADAIAALGPTPEAGGEPYLGVWSRADASIRRLRWVSTDDAFDTQRRRGVAASARTRTEVRTLVQLGLGA